MANTSIYILAGQSNAKGSESAIGRELAERDPDALLVTVAVGGRTLAQKAKEDWNINSEGELYDELITKVQFTVDSVIAQGRQPEIKGLFWIQGEADSGNIETAQSYQDNLQDLVEEIYKGLEDSSFPFIIAELRTTSEKTTYHEDVRDAQYSVAVSNDNVVLLETESFGLSDDGIHYSSNGKKYLAEALFDSAEDFEIPESPDEAEEDVPNDVEDPKDIDIIRPDDANPAIIKDSQLGTGLADIMHGNDSDNLLKSFDGNDTVYGFHGDDRIKGGDGDDVIHGGFGDDKLLGGNGNDLLSGGAGEDSFFFKQNAVLDNHDVITDFESGFDKIVLRMLTLESAESNNNHLTLTFESGDQITILNHSIEDLSIDDFRLQNQSSLDGLF